MATASASYRKPPAAQPVNQPADPGELLRLSCDLAALVAEGLIQTFQDEQGVVRYRPVGKAA